MTRPAPTEAPTLDDIRRAARNLAGRISLPTPLVGSPGLSEKLHANVSLKMETATPIGAFKVRGGIHLLAGLTPAERRAGVITASTGNHGQSIAYAAALFDVRAQIYMPVNANRDKLTAIKRLGAEVVLIGDRFDDARLQAEKDAGAAGARFVHPANEPALIAGVGTAALEVLETQQPETDVVIVPLGGGSGACGWITARDGLDSSAAIWAAQSAQAPAAHDAWRSGQLLERPNATFAEGLATGVAYELPFAVLQRGLNDFILVDDAQIADAVRTLIDLAHVLAEPSAASALAAALKEGDRLQDKNVVLVVSGANVTREQLRALL